MTPPDPPDPPELLIDQENNPTEYAGSDGSVVGYCGAADPVRQRLQTFTAGRTGQLERVSLPLMTYIGDPPPFIVSVHPLLAPDSPDLSSELGRGTYDGPGLGEYDFDPGSVTGFIDVDLESPAPVVAGTPYALVMRADTTGCEAGSEASWVTPVRYATEDSYPGGGTYFWDSNPGVWRASQFNPFAQLDLIFRTWVR